MKLTIFKRIPWAIYLWCTLAIMIAIAGYLSSPPLSERRLFSDQGSHIAAALSIWYDHDLEYTLGDLERFRKAMPAVPGPQGAFLKVGTNGHLYYAKPFLYAFITSPFVAIFGLVGFFIFNELCFMTIGIVAIGVLINHFGQLNALLITIGLLLFSPFIAWTPVAHPDLFIAALIVVGGFLLLKQDYSSAWRAIGAMLLGLVIYEKPPFILLVVPMFIVLYNTISMRLFAIFVTTTYFAWQLPSAINILQDGNIIAYEGLRFYVRGTLGSFPLEKGWPGPPHENLLDHIFTASTFINAVTSNWILMPSKFADALFGRQTGVILYFPFALILLGMTLYRVSWRGTIIVLGLLTYLIIEWMVFPTNGYGGAGSYGPRYTMQAIGVILPALLLPARNRLRASDNQKITTLIISFMLIGAMILQYRVIPPSINVVGTPGWIFQSKLAAMFPIEELLTPTISQIAPRYFSRSDGRGNHLYMIDEGNGSYLDFSSNNERRSIVLYQNERSIINGEAFPPIGVTVTRPLTVEFSVNKEVLGHTFVQPGKMEWVALSDLFKTQFLDGLSGPFRLRQITVRALQPERVTSERVPSLVNFCLENSDFESDCGGSGSYSTPDRLASKGLYLMGGWQKPQDWGIWSNGDYASIIFKTLNHGRTLQLIFYVRSYTPESAPNLDVDLIANGVYIGSWKFHLNTTTSPRILQIPSEFIGDSEQVIIGFLIRHPRSPASVGQSSDQRMIGLGLVDVQWSLVDDEGTHGQLP